MKKDIYERPNDLRGAYKVTQGVKDNLELSDQVLFYLTEALSQSASYGFFKNPSSKMLEISFLITSLVLGKNKTWCDPYTDTQDKQYIDCMQYVIELVNSGEVVSHNEALLYKIRKFHENL